MNPLRLPDRGELTLVWKPVRWLSLGFAQVLVLVIAFGVLMLWYQVSFRVAASHGASHMLDRIDLTRGDDQSNRRLIFTLGRRLLMQNEVRGAAAEQHIRFTSHPDGRWQIGNASASRPLLLEFSDGLEMRTSRQLASGVGAVTLSSRGDVTWIRPREVTPTSMEFELVRNPDSRPSLVLASYRVRVEGLKTVLCRIGAGQEQCLPEPFEAVDWLRSSVQRLLPGRRPQERLVVRFGGEALKLGRRIAVLPVPGYDFDGLRLVWLPGRGFAFAPGWDVHAEFLPRNEDQPAGRWRFGDIQHDLDGGPSGRRITKLIAGRTVYGLQHDTPETLVLRPLRNHHRHLLDADGSARLADQAPIESPGHVTWLPKPIAPLPDVWAQSPFLKVVLWPGLPFLAGLFAAFWLVRRIYAAWHRKRGRAVQRLTGSDMVGIVFVGLSWALVLVTSGPLAVWLVENGLPAPPHIAIAAWGIAILAVFRVSGSSLHAKLLFILFTALVGTGSIVLLALAVSVEELRWARFYGETLEAIVLGAAMISTMALVPTSTYARIAVHLSQRGPLGLSWGLLAVLVLCLFNWGIWTIFGTESGIAGLFQPSEAIKTLYAVLFAALLNLMLCRQFGARAAPTWSSIALSAAGVFLILGLVMFEPITANDFSPFLILLLSSVLAIGMVILLHVAARASERLSMPIHARRPPTDPDRPGLTLMWLCWHEPTVGFPRVGRMLGRKLQRHWVETAVLAGVALVCWGLVWGFNRALQQPEQTRIWLEENAPDLARKPVRRALSWLELSLHRAGQTGAEVNPIDYQDTGRQVLMSRSAIDDAPCHIVSSDWVKLQWGPAQTAMHWIKQHLASFCPSVQTTTSFRPVTDLKIPEIQNDFIVAWVFHALGRDGAYLLMMLEMATVLMMVLGAFRVMSWNTVDENRRIATTFFANLTIIFAVMLTMQMTISWMNAFGELPVMGQPMTFISQGRSHFIAFGIPVMIAVMMGMRLMQKDVVRQISRLPDMGLRAIDRRTLRKISRDDRPENPALLH